MERKHYIFLYILFSLGLVFFMLAVIFGYESDYGNGKRTGNWHSESSMTKIEYFVHKLTYLVSFPLGTLFGLFDNDYVAKKWLLVVAPNFFIY